MKYLWLIRHAKSSWKDATLSDHDRPLNKRGNRDAPSMAKRFAEHRHAPSYIASSTAIRARTTAEIFKKALDLGDDYFMLEPSLYHATMEAAIDVIQALSDDIDHAALFGHNPTWTNLVQSLAGEGPDNVPTTGCALLSSITETWLDFERGEIELVDFIYPKMYL